MKWNRWRDVPPCSTYDIPGMEEWLSRQAARGRALFRQELSRLKLCVADGDREEERT